MSIKFFDIALQTWLSLVAIQTAAKSKKYNYDYCRIISKKIPFEWILRVIFKQFVLVDKSLEMLYVLFRL
jgi:hypothetical protein